MILAGLGLGWIIHSKGNLKKEERSGGGNSVSYSNIEPQKLKISYCVKTMGEDCKRDTFTLFATGKYRSA